MTDDQEPPIGSIGMFNTYSVEIRSKIDTLVKQVLFLSAGTQAITIGAFLTGTPPRLPNGAAELLTFGWCSLSLCIVLCLIFMLSQVLAMVSVGRKFKSKIEQLRPGAEIMVASMPLRIFNWIVGLSAFASCAIGIVAISKAAMALIGAPAGA
jgi:hypothetical protein